MEANKFIPFYIFLVFILGPRAQSATQTKSFSAAKQKTERRLSESSAPDAANGTSSQGTNTAIGAFLIHAVGSKNIVGRFSSITQSEKLAVGQILSDGAKKIFSIVSIKDGMIVLKAEDSPGNLKKGDSIELFDSAEAWRAEKLLREFEPEKQNQNKNDSPLASTDFNPAHVSIGAAREALSEEKKPSKREFMDMDFMPKSSELVLKLDNHVSLNEGYTLADSASSASADVKENGLSNSIGVFLGLGEIVAVKAQLNYVASRKYEVRPNSGTSTETKYSGIADPEFGATFRFKERKAEGDYSASLSVDFSPTLVSRKHNLKGRTTPGTGYAQTTITAPFVWKSDNSEYGFSPIVAYTGIGNSEGIDGAKTYNFDSTFAFGFGGGYQYSFSRGFRLETDLTIAFPFSTSTTYNYNPNLVEKVDVPVTFLLNVKPQVALASENRLVLFSDISGKVPTSKADVKLTQGARSATGTASFSFWIFDLGLKYLF